MESRYFWRRLAEQNRWRQENQWSTSKPAELQPTESSHVYIDCAKAVSLAESALIAEIHHIILDQPPSRYLIDATSCLQLQECAKDRFVLHILFKDRVGIKHNLTIDQPQLSFHQTTIRPEVMDGTKTTQIKGIGNRTIINQRRITKTYRVESSMTDTDERSRRRAEWSLEQITEK
ncbi:MAG: hypothetical protein EZS28_007743 [Streblomastix strix]|uniref:Uncharacterized protein n=1 Tax=Streblomastix strix TaxID=222440 RepID=A0A5J4WP41_9EUKA|nr:MAG: hypothetical protein EZS28_007743 [Streblomastix strix]